jgi:hypothetical protein
MTMGQDIAGLVQSLSTIGSLTVGSPSYPGSVTATGIVSSVGNMGSVVIYGNVAGILQAGGTIGTMTIDGSVIPTQPALAPGTVAAGIIRAGNVDNLAVGGAMAGLVTVSGNLNTMSVGQDMSGLVNVSQTLGQLTVTGGTPGSIVAKTIGMVGVDGGYGPVVAQINENGIQRRVEAAVPTMPYPAATLYSYPTSAALASPAGVSFEFLYEGLASNNGTLANPQLTMRVTNNSANISPDQYDLSLVTWSNAAQFNLARLDANTATNNGVSGIRNVDVEGSLLASVTPAAQSFFNLSSAQGGVRLPMDSLAGVAVRDNAPVGSVTAKSIQGIAFGSLTSSKTTQTGAASNQEFASQLLTSGTTIVETGTVNANEQETFRVPVDN